MVTIPPLAPAMALLRLPVPVMPVNVSLAASYWIFCVIEPTLLPNPSYLIGKETVAPVVMHVCSKIVALAVFNK